MGTTNRSRLLYIRHILETETDENHKMSVNDLIEKLAHLGIEAKRRAVQSDIELLQEYGMDIICEMGKPNRYFIGMRVFELPEIKLLIDAVQSSAFITEKRADSFQKSSLRWQATIRQTCYADIYIPSGFQNRAMKTFTIPST